MTSPCLLAPKSVGNVNFKLANTTFYPLNPGWASDGVFPLAWSDDSVYISALTTVLGSVAGSQEVTLCGVWNRVSLANTKVNGLEALISIASPFLATPPESFRSLVKTLKGKYNDELHLYTVDCGKVGVLPEIRINLGPGFGIQYAVSAEKYVPKMNTILGPKCALLLVQTEKYYAWTIGAQFLPKSCINLDYQSGHISFADPVQSS
ncbi:Peptidase A1 [Aphelenchoides avenae]|nr:Peptidase A1 [Aphelenchus avenae]